jgi:hypothetical protein
VADECAGTARMRPTGNPNFHSGRTLIPKTGNRSDKSMVTGNMKSPVVRRSHHTLKHPIAAASHTFSGLFNIASQEIGLSEPELHVRDVLLSADLTVRWMNRRELVHRVRSMHPERCESYAKVTVHRGIARLARRGLLRVSPDGYAYLSPTASGVELEFLIQKFSAFQRKLARFEELVKLAGTSPMTRSVEFDEESVSISADLNAIMVSFDNWTERLYTRLPSALKAGRRLAARRYNIELSVVALLKRQIEFRLRLRNRAGQRETPDPVTRMRRSSRYPGNPAHATRQLPDENSAGT